MIVVHNRDCPKVHKNVHPIHGHCFGATVIISERLMAVFIMLWAPPPLPTYNGLNESMLDTKKCSVGPQLSAYI